MGPLAVAAGITGIGALIGGERQNAANAREAHKNRQFQEHMSSTAYQRAVDDMRKAGLNPALAYQQGGASAAGGSQARMENTIEPGVSNARATSQAAASINEINARTKLVNTEENIARTQAQWHNAMLANQSTRDAILTQVWGNPEYKQILINQMKEDLRLTSTHAREGEQRIKIGQPSEDAADTWWKRKVSPYINDASTAVRIGTSVAMPLAVRGAGAAVQRNIAKLRRGQIQRP